MSLTYDFIVRLAERFAPPPGQLLDFGCGGGEVVAKAAARGWEAQGVDTYDDMWEQYAGALDRLPRRITRLRVGEPLPFAAESFDVIVTNQVLEHVRDLPAVASELTRVLRGGGILVAVFPSREVLLEHHLHAPLVHRFPAGGEWQRRALFLWHVVRHPFAGPRARAAWIEGSADSLRRFIFYRTVAATLAALGPEFELIARGEADFIRHRLARSAALHPFARLPRQADPLLAAAGLRLANAVLVLRRR
jgi:SAM-dependent methyltransferase